MSKIELTKEAYRKLGINLSDEQFMDLATINLMQNMGEIDENDHVTIILFILRMLGLIPEEPTTRFPMEKITYRDKSNA